MLCVSLKVYTLWKDSVFYFFNFTVRGYNAKVQKQDKFKVFIFIIIINAFLTGDNIDARTAHKCNISRPLLWGKQCTKYYSVLH